MSQILVVLLRQVKIRLFIFLNCLKRVFCCFRNSNKTKLDNANQKIMIMANDFVVVQDDGDTREIRYDDTIINSESPESLVNLDSSCLSALGQVVTVGNGGWQTSDVTGSSTGFHQNVNDPFLWANNEFKGSILNSGNSKKNTNTGNKGKFNTK